MNLTELALKRPIAVAMVFLALGLIGFLSWQRLPLELMPNLNYPQLTIVTTCENIAPLEMETLVTKNLEAALGTVSRVRRLESFSREGLSIITLNFEWGTDMNTASLEAREKLDRVRDILPKEVSTPLIIRFDPAALPVLTLAVKGETQESQELQDTVVRVIKRDLERVAGVASVRLSGSREREIRVAVDLGRLAAHKIPISSVRQALETANLNYPGGKIVQGQWEFPLRTVGEFREIEDIGKVGFLRHEGRPPVSLQDLADIQDTFKEEHTVARINGKPSLMLAIFKMADANTVQVVDRVKEKVETLNRQYEGRLQLLVAQDQGRFIRQSLFQLGEAAVLGGLLAFGVLLGFLANFGSAVIIVTAIPISILATFSLMYLAGISLNMMSLGGLALGIGMLVDNGVVVLENIRRHQESGAESPYQAILQGTSEVKLAITASTLAHIVVFVPVIFVGGLGGQFLYQVGLTISFSLLMSLAVALVLNPMLVSLGLRQARRGEIFLAEPRSWGTRLRDYLDGLYVPRLLKTLENPRPVFWGTLALFLASLVIFFLLGRELLPTLDQRQVILRLTPTANASFAVIDQHMQAVENLVLASPAVDTVISQFGYNPKEQYEKLLEGKESRAGLITVTLKSQGGSPRSTAAWLDELKPRLAAVTDFPLEFIFPQSLGQWWGQKAQAPELLALQGHDLDTLERLSRDALTRIKGIPGLQDLEISLEKYGQESRIVIDRERAAAFGLSVKEIGEALKTLIQGEVASQFRQGDQDIDIRVQLNSAQRETLPSLEQISLYSQPLKTDIALLKVARVEKGPGVREVQRLNQERIVSIRGNIVDRSRGRVQADMDRALKDLPLPSGYTLVRGGEAQEMQRSFYALLGALLLSIILVFMLLAGQFESLFNPLIIMLAIPLALVGVALTLGLTGWGLSLGVFFGAIMLGGIVVNNSILLVDQANQFRRQGQSLKDAVVLGSRARLRPILMTTLATILALLPLALSRGEGAELRVPLALTVIGGLLASTFLTLFLVPLMYLKGEEFLQKWRSAGRS
ncbi:MAG: efflux RND transporter permease subunit [Desulfobaccales bacterium]